MQPKSQLVRLAYVFGALAVGAVFSDPQQILALVCGALLLALGWQSGKGPRKEGGEVIAIHTGGTGGAGYNDLWTGYKLHPDGVRVIPSGRNYRFDGQNWVEL